MKGYEYLIFFLTVFFSVVFFVLSWMSKKAAEPDNAWRSRLPIGVVLGVLAVVEYLFFTQGA